MKNVDGLALLLEPILAPEASESFEREFAITNNAMAVFPKPVGRITSVFLPHKSPRLPVDTAATPKLQA